jgi:hypothetical protein
MNKIIGSILALTVFGFVFVYGSPDPAPKPNLSTPGFLIDDHIHYGGTDQWEKDFLELISWK